MPPCLFAFLLIQFDQPLQIERLDRTARDLPRALAAQTAHGSLFVGLDSGLKAGRAHGLGLAELFAMVFSPDGSLIFSAPLRLGVE